MTNKKRNKGKNCIQDPIGVGQREEMSGLMQCSRTFKKMIGIFFKSRREDILRVTRETITVYSRMIRKWSMLKFGWWLWIDLLEEEGASLKDIRKLITGYNQYVVNNFTKGTAWGEMKDKWKRQFLQLLNYPPSHKNCLRWCSRNNEGRSSDPFEKN